MKKWIILGLLLIAPSADAATVYFDSSAADGGNGSSGTPYNQFSDYSPSANDTLVCTGTFPETVTISNISGISIIGSGGCVIEGGGVRDYGLHLDRTSNLLVQGIEVKNQLKNGIRAYNNTANSTTTGLMFVDTLIRGTGPGSSSPSGNEDSLEIGTCLLVRSGTTTGTGVITNVTVRNVDVTDCGKHGMDFRWRVYNVLVEDSEASYNGLTATGHGISIHPMNNTVTGWTLFSGSTYRATRLSTNDREQRLVNKSSSTILTQKTSATTSLATNEWAVDGTNLWVNLGGANPTTVDLQLKRHAHGPFVIRDSYAHHNDSGVDSAEGHGIDADDSTGPALFINNRIEDNYGNGMMSFYGENVTMVGNVARNNGATGFYTYSCTNCILYNNTADSNDDLGFYGGGSFNPGMRLFNNIATRNTTRGFSQSASTSADSGYSTGSNISWGNLNNNTCTNVTCTLVDPVYSFGGEARTPNDLRLSPNSPAIRAGTRVGDYTDYFGRTYNFKPSIGAVEQATGDIVNRSLIQFR